MFEWTDGKLRNEGEVVHLFDADGLLVDFVRYNNHQPWPEGDALLGKSIELVSSLLDNHFASSWQASDAAGGTPGEVIGVSGAPAPASDWQLTIFPNPASGVLHVALKGDLRGQCAIRLIDAMGREVYAGQMSEGSGLRQAGISLEGAGTGIYFVILAGEKGRVLEVERVVVIK